MTTSAVLAGSITSKGCGRPARRIILLARKGSAAPLTLAQGLVLHEPGGAYSPAADAVLRGAGLDIA